MTEKQFKKEHLLEATEWRGNGYLNTNLINQSQSYFIESRPRIYGGCYVYQFITMTDGTIYELFSMTVSTRGIVAYNCHARNVLQRDVKQFRESAIHY